MSTEAPATTRPDPNDPAERAEVARLCEDYMPLALKIARKYARLFPSLDFDFESEAGEGLWKAAKTRHTWPAKFATLVRLQVVGRCTELITQERKRPDSPLNAADDTNEGDGPPQSIASSVADDARPVEVMAEVRDLLFQLPQKRRATIIRHFFGGEEWTELGAEFGVSGKAVEQMAARDLATVRGIVRQDSDEYGGDA